MQKRLKLLLGLVLLLGSLVLFSSFLGADPAVEPTLEALPSTLPPQLFSGRTAQAYGVAAEIPDILAGLACYCGCDRSSGHRHLLDCFADDHAVG